MSMLAMALGRLERVAERLGLDSRIQQFSFWKEDEVNSRLRDILTTAFR